jgi:hypothetical protein
MSPETIAVDRIEVIPSGFFTVQYAFQSPAGVLGVLTVPAFREGTIFRDADGLEWKMRRRGFWRVRYEMEPEGGPGAVARPRGFWQSALEIAFRDRLCLLEPIGKWSDKWRLSAEGVPLLELRRRGALRQGLIVEVLGPVEVELIAFACYLVLTRWREHAAAAAA